MGPFPPHQRLLGRLLRVSLLLSLPLSLQACGSQAQYQRIVSAPAPSPQSRSEVLILPPGQKMREEIPYWTLESQRLVLAYFDIFLRHGLETKTTSRVFVAEDEDETQALEFAFQSMGRDQGSEWWAYVPQAGQVAHQGRYPDYVLIFDGLRFRIHGGGGARQTYDVPGTGKVEVDLEYVLWDNQNQEVVASGRLHEESYTNSPSVSNEIFKELFEKMADDVVRRSPLG